MIIGSLAGLLEQEGIQSEIRNDFLGGAAGEIAPGETWIELWVLEVSQVARAEQIIEDAMQAPQGEDWQCRRCKETNPATFETCWNCGSAKPDTA